MRATPRALGFRMPAEWEPHEATWIAWPHNRDDWPGRFAPIPWVYAEIVRKLARVERVRILIQDGAAEEAARRVLRKSGANLDAVEFFHAPTDRGWTRDYGPLFVSNRAGDVALTNWHFNAWAKYDDWRNDAAIPGTLARALKLRAWEPGLVLEGGSIDVNGKGLLLTTEECLLSPVQARNPQLDRRQIERALCDYLGARRIVWLRNGIAGDDTHGHVDDLARFVNADTVAIASEPERNDANYEPHARRVCALLLGYHCVEVEAAHAAHCSSKATGSNGIYANFYIANGLVLVPTFNDPRDRIALNTLARLFPGRVVWAACRRRAGVGIVHAALYDPTAAGAVTI